MQKKEHKGKIKERLIRSIWSSLESHLDGMWQKTPEGRRFHSQCVVDYTKQILEVMKL